MPAAAVGPQSWRLHGGLSRDSEGGVSSASDRNPGPLQAAQRGRHPGYIDAGEWRGKAGGYAVQGIAGSFVVKMVGSYTNVVGLPLYESVTLLAARASYSRRLVACQLNRPGSGCRANRSADRNLARNAPNRRPGHRAVLFPTLQGCRSPSVAIG